MFIAWGWIVFAVFAFVISCIAAYAAGVGHAFESPNIVKVFSDLEDYKRWLEDRECELEDANVEREKLLSDIRDEAKLADERIQRIESLARENAQLRRMILDAKNVLMES